MLLCVFSEKKPLLPDLWPVAIPKNSTTGNFRKARSNSSFWNRAEPRRRDHLPAQYVKSKTERQCSGGREDVSAGYKTASKRMQHVGIGLAWVLLGCMCSVCDSWVTLWQVLKSYESKAHTSFFFCLFPTRPTTLHTSCTWQRFTVLEQMAEHTAAHVKWSFRWMNMSTTGHSL